ncbi:phage shock protein C (PspC) family protein [bacterium A37T11]|nr:phage shock protein C (PspC) family protein [bacterium A37T11]
MNKTIIININGTVFHIEEDAYEVLRKYMIAIKKHFGYTNDSHEIVNDIENRIAEMFNDRIQEGKREVITMADVQEVCTQMGSVSDFDTSEADYAELENDLFGASYNRNERKLFRDPEDRIFGGVCAGLGHYFNMEPRWVRVIFVLLFLFAGSGFLFYLILWAVMPVAKSRADRMAMRGEAPNLQNFKRSFDEEMGGIRANFPGAADNLRHGLHSAGNVLAKLFIILVKIVGVFFIVGLCGGLVTLIISIFATFGFLGMDNDMAMFPFNVIDPSYRNGLLISALVTAIIPIIALILLAIRILFNKPVLGRYTGFSLLIIWVVAIGFTVSYSIRTLSDFREESTVVEERRLVKVPIFKLIRNDLTVVSQVPGTSRRIGVRHRSMFEGMRNVRIQIVQIDSLLIPSVTEEFSARGNTFDEATKRAGKLSYHLTQIADTLQFDSQFSLDEQELMRNQSVLLKLNVPIGTHLLINRDLERHIMDLPLSQCADNYKYKYGDEPGATEWVMTTGGLKCTLPPPPPDTADEN